MKLNEQTIYSFIMERNKNYSTLSRSKTLIIQIISEFKANCDLTVGGITNRLNSRLSKLPNPPKKLKEDSVKKLLKILLKDGFVSCKRVSGSNRYTRWISENNIEYIKTYFNAPEEVLFDTEVMLQQTEVKLREANAKIKRLEETIESQRKKIQVMSEDALKEMDNQSKEDTMNMLSNEDMDSEIDNDTANSKSEAEKLANTIFNDIDITYQYDVINITSQILRIKDKYERDEMIELVTNTYDSDDQTDTIEEIKEIIK